MPRPKLNSVVQSELDNMTDDEMLLASFNKIKRVRANMKAVSAELTEKILSKLVSSRETSGETLKAIGDFDAAFKTKS